MQREFPWLSIMAQPRDAEPHILAMCHSLQDAFAGALRSKGAGFTASWFAKRLGVSSAYISQIKKGTRPLPDWIVGPVCVLAGTNLLQQYIDVQNAMRAYKKQRTPNERADAIAAELRKVA